MRIAYVTPFDASILSAQNNWSGTGYYISQSLKNQSISIDYIGPLTDKLLLKTILKLKSRFYSTVFGKTYIKDTEPLILKDYAKQISEKLLRSKADIVFSASSNSVAYLECNQPIVFWGDATFANLIGFYPQYSNPCQESLHNAHVMESVCLSKAKLAIYSSEWAAQKAVDYYKINPDKVKVVPFGANVESNKSIDEINTLVAERPKDKCKLLFLGIDWFRKGGDVALAVTKHLNQLGLNTELTVVGCDPIDRDPLPDYVKPLGFIGKSNPEGKTKIYQLIAESHFLILPSMADCTPIVFCEANALGVPCISRRIGGIPTIIKDDLNGKLFEKDIDVTHYAKYIYDIFTNYDQYKQLALSAFHEYESRLNWRISGAKVRDLLMKVV